jgi:phasin family protein
MAMNLHGIPTPVLDLPGLFNFHRKNFEALTAASQILFAGTQAVFQRQAELAKQAFDNTLATAPGLLQAPSVETVGVQLEAAKGLLDTVTSNARELGSLLLQTGTEAATLLAGRVSAGLTEAQAAVTPAAATPMASTKKA